MAIRSYSCSRTLSKQQDLNTLFHENSICLLLGTTKQLSYLQLYQQELVWWNNSFLNRSHPTSRAVNMSRCRKISLDYLAGEKRKIKSPHRSYRSPLCFHDAMAVQEDPLSQNKVKFANCISAVYHQNNTNKFKSHLCTGGPSIFKSVFMIITSTVWSHACLGMPSSPLVLCTTSL